MYRSRAAIHGWMRKVDRRLVDGVDPNRIAVDGTGSRRNDRRH
jgi:hypothetical protein